MSDRTPPDEVIAKAVGSIPDGAFLTGAVVLMSYILPGEPDEDDQGPFLAWRTDGTAGRWVHLGMLEAAANDFRADLRDMDDR